MHCTESLQLKGAMMSVLLLKRLKTAQSGRLITSTVEHMWVKCRWFQKSPTCETWTTLQKVKHTDICCWHCGSYNLRLILFLWGQTWHRLKHLRPFMDLWLLSWRDIIGHFPSGLLVVFLHTLILFIPSQAPVVWRWFPLLRTSAGGGAAPHSTALCPVGKSQWARRNQWEWGESADSQSGERSGRERQYRG